MNAALKESPVNQEPGTLKSRTLSAGMWVGAGSMLGNVIRLGSNLIVARLLFPEAFGLMMIATAVTVIVTMLSDVGIQQSIIRGSHGENPVFLDTAWTFQILRGFFIWLGVCCVAYALTVVVDRSWISKNSTYADPTLPWIMAVISATAVIQGFQSTDLAMASRKLTMKRVVLLELVVQVVSVITMCALAWWLRSVWAAVASGLLSALLHSTLSHFALRLHRHRLHIDQNAFRELFSFGKWVALSSTAYIFVVNGDRLILGVLVTPQIMGLYSIAVALATVFDQTLSTIFNKVILPAISEVARNRPDQLARIFYHLRWRLDPAVVLLGGALFALGPAIVGTLYDSRYIQAGEMLQILSLGLVLGRLTLVQQVYLALNEPRYLVILNAARVLSLLAVPLAFQVYGLTGALFAIAFRELPVLPIIFWLNKKHNLNNFRLELLWLTMWPVGWLLGRAVLVVFN